ncbi:MAG TPA: ABC transporter permease [Phycisphaerae bacterium]|nr:ABC transporter permease [Phycisphaerae bacterium]
MTMIDTVEETPEQSPVAVPVAATVAAAPLPPDAPADEHTLFIRPASGWAALDLREVWHFRDLLFTLAGRDLKLRYKQTALGAIWVLIQPLAAAGISTVVFGQIAKLSSDGLPYFLFAFAGQLGWSLFSNTVGKSSGCLVGNAHLISKVYFPRFILPLSSLPSTLVDFAIAGAMMVCLLFAYHVMPGFGLLLLPFWMAIFFAMALGIGLVASALTVDYRDVGYILPVFMQLLAAASPVSYGVSNIPKSILPFYNINPLTPVLQGFRWSLLNTAPPNWWNVAYATALAALLLFAGAFSFKRMERRFADVV